ncbi:cobalt-precorrin 5A hydrolase [Paraburkholderia sp. RAU2J]|uniref:cobalamin biosynthesis protein n=1 Tax=Paraburkholderia sp. RAU2J TaxID=1938810 RepID=UPI000EB26D19|nr:cobalamin biosynthesis protein [Paraburkholderia sp. RAU2J]RKT21629.1 cobalt-precorrin 5A hydrolase [Paraburkholderia sp. RAU2J]
MKTLSVGIGCRLNTSPAQIEAAVRAALGPHAIDRIRAIASVDTKADEPGLLEFCARHALPLLLFSREQIAAITVATPSDAVREHLGVDGVCEPCALLAASCEPAALVAATVRGARVAHTASDVGAIPPAALATSAARAVPIAPTAPTARLLVSKTHHADVTVAIATAATDASVEPPDHAPHRQDLR